MDGKPAELDWRAQHLEQVFASDTARDDVILVQRMGLLGLVQGVVVGHDGRGRTANVHVSIDSSSEIVIKGKVQVYAIRSSPDTSCDAKTTKKAKAAAVKTKNAHMRKYTPPKKKQTSVSFAGQGGAAKDQPFVGIWSAFETAGRTSKKVDRETKAFMKEAEAKSSADDTKAQREEKTKAGRELNPESQLAQVLMDAPAQPRLKRRVLASALHKIR